MQWSSKHQCYDCCYYNSYDTKLTETTVVHSQSPTLGQAFPWNLCQKGSEIDFCICFPNGETEAQRDEVALSWSCAQLVDGSTRIYKAQVFLSPEQSIYVLPSGNQIECSENHHLTVNQDYCTWASLVAQWLRIYLPMQGTRVRSLVQEDPTCRGATKPVRHNY